MQDLKEFIKDEFGDWAYADSLTDEVSLIRGHHPYISLNGRGVV